MTRFLLIRHAMTDAVGKRLAGRMPGIPLNQEGDAQVKILTGRLAGLSIDAIYSSPLERAVATARPVAEMMDIGITTYEDFTEINFGDWTDRSIGSLEDDPQFKQFNIFRSHTRIPGGELMVEAQARMISGLEKLCLLHPDQTVAVVSHGDMIRAAIAYYAGIPIDLFQRLEISPASVSIIEIYAQTTRIVTTNHTADMAGLFT